MKKHIFTLLAIVLIVSCTPKISYLGDSYPPTYEVDMYFDEKDIERDYKVIGLARNEGDELEIDDLDAIRKSMLKKAREVGADAILFISIAENREGWDDDPNKIVEAKFLKYK
jgi:hypothetical protein